MMTATRDWTPDLYLRFARQRGRPLQDLLAALVDSADKAPVETAVDLGCGPGNSTEALATRFPGAEITGVDTSDAMLDDARRRLPGTRFVKADAATWSPEAPVDLILANALLQWIPGHAALLPRLMAALRPGGWLAVQMPDNLDEPSHRLMRAVAADGPWAEALSDAGGARADIGGFTDYHDWLDGHAEEIEVWRTTYVHRLPGPDAIVDWMRGAGLTPYLKRLAPGQEEPFLDAYRRGIAAAYPARADGSVLLEFPRLFVMARRAAA